MKNASCIECIYLVGSKDHYDCLSSPVSRPVSNDIALGWRDDLPDCPYFREREEEDKIHLESKELVVVKARHRARRKRKYTIPIKYNKTKEETQKEILDIIIAFHEKRKTWPSLIQITRSSRFRSSSYVWETTRTLLNEGKLVTTNLTSSTMYRVGYRIPKIHLE